MPNEEPREPDGVETVEQATAGEAEESGPEATLEALRSPEKYRLSEEELDERDDRFTGPRKEQGPLREEPEERESLADEEGEETEETPPPEPQDEEQHAE
jgi:hypothetical protein